MSCCGSVEGEFLGSLETSATAVMYSYNPPWVAKELGFSPSSCGGVCSTNEKGNALQELQDKEGYGKTIPGDATSLLSLLKICIKNKDLCRGSRIHEDILQRGLLEKCSDALVVMYAKCGMLEKAKELHDKYQSTDAITWNTLIVEYARQGLSGHAIVCFDCMRHEGIFPDTVTYASILKACGIMGDLKKGQQIHHEILRQGLLQNVVLGSALVGMYAKCGAVSKAQCVFDKLHSRNVVSWNALMSGYTQDGQGEQTLSCFERMQHEGINPDAVTYACILKACGAIGAADTGERIHDQILRQGLLQSDVMLGNALVDMYAKCGALFKAHRVLEELPARNVVSWNSLITGYIQKSQGEQALNCFERMQGEGITPNEVAYICILKACGILCAIDKGKQIHDQIAREELLQNDIVLGGALVDMYAKCGALVEAQDVLDDLPSRSVVSWSALIAGYAQKGQGEQALSCFDCMQHDGIFPNAVTCTSLLKACGAIGAVEKGKEIHDLILRQRLLQDDIILGTAIVDMYAQCGAFVKAQSVFEELPSRNVVSWNVLITGYIQHGQNGNAWTCFERMQHEGIPPNVATYISVLKACGGLRAIDRGRKVHDKIGRQGFLQNYCVIGNALVDMYAKCGALLTAQNVLEKLPFRDVVSWNSLIGGYAYGGQAEQAMKSFECMQLEKTSPDVVTYICILKACGAVGAADKGKEIHDQIARQGFLHNDIVLDTALVDMYAKCGALLKAKLLLDELPSRTVVSWNALIAGYGQEGEVEQPLRFLECMQSEGIAPNAVTFVSMLNVCGHLGLLEEGSVAFMSMNTKYGIIPDLECYGCMIDLFGRSGHVDRAARLIQKMLTCGDLSMWHAVLSACLKWGNVNIGRWAFEQALLLDSHDASTHVLMGNIYAAVDMDKDAKNMLVCRLPLGYTRERMLVCGW